MDILSVFVERLKEYIDERGLSVSSLAKKINTSRATVSALTNGAHLPSTEVLLSLVKLFECSADYLLGFTDYPNAVDFSKTDSFAERLKKCMTENGISEYRLRIDQNLSGSVTYRWLAGKAEPTVESLIKLKSYFGCSFDYLLGIGN